MTLFLALGSPRRSSVGALIWGIRIYLVQGHKEAAVLFAVEESLGFVCAINRALSTIVCILIIQI